MELHTLDLWEIALVGTQICLCGLILLFLIRNRKWHKRISGKAPATENARNFNTEFIIEAIRQQTESAFDRILDTINKERHSLEAYFELSEAPSIPDAFKSISTGLDKAVFAQGPAELVAADAIYNEIEILADEGMNLTDISEKLNVPQGEVDLVLRLKRLGAESGKKRAS